MRERDEMKQRADERLYEEQEERREREHAEAVSLKTTFIATPEAMEFLNQRTEPVAGE
jgi:hypothetical protein